MTAFGLRSSIPLRTVFVVGTVAAVGLGAAEAEGGALVAVPGSVVGVAPVVGLVAATMGATQRTRKRITAFIALPMHVVLLMLLALLGHELGGDATERLHALGWAAT